MEEAVNGFFHGQLGDFSRLFLRLFRFREGWRATSRALPLTITSGRSEFGVAENSPSRMRSTTRTNMGTASCCRERGCHSVFGGSADSGKVSFGMIAPILK